MSAKKSIKNFLENLFYNHTFICAVRTTHFDIIPDVSYTWILLIVTCDNWISFTYLYLVHKSHTRIDITGNENKCKERQTDWRRMDGWIYSSVTIILSFLIFEI